MEPESQNTSSANDDKTTQGPRASKLSAESAPTDSLDSAAIYADLRKHVRATARTFKWLLVIFLAATVLILAVSVFFHRPPRIAPGEPASVDDTSVPTSNVETTVVGSKTEKQGEEDGYTRDVMVLAIPIMIAVIGYAAAVLGLKRLEQIDAEISTVRSEIWGRMDKHQETLMNQHIPQIFGVLKGEIETGLKAIDGSIGATVSKLFAKELGEQEARLNDTVGPFDERVQKRIKDIETKLKPYEWLKDRHEDIDGLENVASIENAHTEVTRLFAEDHPDAAILLTERVIKKEMPGGPDDFHNLGAELAKKGQYPLAFQVIANGLERYENSVDLLADAVKYAVPAGEHGKVDVYYKRLQAVPRTEWKWRAYVFMGDRLELQGNIEGAEKLYEEFRKVLPDDERGYSQPGAYYHRMGQLDKAIDILKEGIESIQNCSQCASVLADCYFAKGQYAQAIQAADRALASNADDQPSRNEASILFTRATSQDAMLISKLAELELGTVIPQELVALYRAACLDYRSAIDAYDSQPRYRVRGEARMRILKAELERHGWEAEGMDDERPEESPGERPSPEEATNKLIDLFKAAKEAGVDACTVAKDIAKANYVDSLEGLFTGLAKSRGESLEDFIAYFAEQTNYTVEEIKAAIDAE